MQGDNWRSKLTAGQCGYLDLGSVFFFMKHESNAQQKVVTGARFNFYPLRPIFFVHDALTAPRGQFTLANHGCPRVSNGL